MMGIYKDVTAAVGHTPLVEIEKLIDSPARVLVKLESRNPMASVKDRIAVSMIDAAEREGLLDPGGTVIEPTSGNTGIGLAMVCAARGYKLILTMPDSMSVERRKVLQALGAELVLTEAADGMHGAIERAEQLCTVTPNSFMPQQFNNPANAEVHRLTTAVEIWDDTQGQVDVLIAGVGTGGTITGCGEGLKERNPNVQIIAVEPAESPVITQFRAGEPLAPGPHGIQGIGAGFIPKVLDMDLLDEVICVTTEDAITMARRAALEEAIFVGISTGAALMAAAKVATRPELAGKTIVVIAPSFGERYLSTPLFSHLEG
jgi:cysteine synthase A